MVDLNAETRSQILKDASDLNYWGKKVLASKRKVVTTIISKHLGIATPEDLIEYLDANKPAKTPTSKAPVDNTPTLGGHNKDRDERLAVIAGSRFIITAAQHNTQPSKALNTLKNMSQDLGAKLLVMPLVYAATIKPWERAQPREFDAAIKPYVVSDDAWLGEQGLVRLAVTANIIPTAKRPINNARDLNNGEFITIVASPRAQFQTLPRTLQESSKGIGRWVYTTRCCTLPHYIESRIGAESEADHWYGGVYIEIDYHGNISHQHIVSNSTGDVIFQGAEYTSKNTYPIDYVNPAAIVLGDIHSEKTDPDCFNKTIKWLEQNKPGLIIVHDLLDFSSRNHHNRDSGRFLYSQEGRSVLDDLNDVINILNQLTDIAPVFVVESNHDNALDRWLDAPAGKYDPDKDPINAKTFYLLKLAVLQSIDSGDQNIPMLELAIDELISENAIHKTTGVIQFGSVNTVYSVAGVRVSDHGHIGQSGARGSLITFKRLGVLHISGHTHSPAQDGTAACVGVTGALDMGYNKGLSLWDRLNFIINHNGTIQGVPLFKIGEPQT